MWRSPQLMGCGASAAASLYDMGSFEADDRKPTTFASPHGSFCHTKEPPDQLVDRLLRRQQEEAERVRAEVDVSTTQSHLCSMPLAC